MRSRWRRDASLATLACLCLAACDNGEPALERSDKVYTLWGAILDPDGSHMSVVLEPRVLHRESRGVWLGDGSSDNGGAAVAVDTATGRRAIRLDPGPKTTVIAGGSALVFTRGDYHQGTSALAMGPPETSWLSVERLDRSTLAPTGALTFPEPLGRPRVLPDGRTILELPGAPISDTERDIDLVAYDLDAPDRAPERLFHDRGFHALSCVAEGVVLAYEPSAATGSLRVVNVSREGASWKVLSTTIAAARLVTARDSELACDGPYAAFQILSTSDGLPHLLVTKAGSATAAVDLPGAAPPFVLGGGAILSRGASGRLVLARRGSAREAQVETVIDADRVVTMERFGESVLVGADGTYLVSLQTGEARLVSPTTCETALVQGRRAVCIHNPGGLAGPKMDRAAQVFEVRESGDTSSLGEVTLGGDYSELRVAAIAGEVAWLATSREPASERLVAIDLRGGSRVGELAVPACDPTSVEEQHACLP